MQSIENVFLLNCDKIKIKEKKKYKAFYSNRSVFKLICLLKTFILFMVWEYKVVIK